MADDIEESQPLMKKYDHGYGSLGNGLNIQEAEKKEQENPA